MNRRTTLMERIDWMLPRTTDPALKKLLSDCQRTLEQDDVEIHDLEQRIEWLEGQAGAEVPYLYDDFDD